MRRRVTAGLVAVVALLALVGCGAPVRGEIVGKDVRPAYTYVHMQPIYTTTCSGSGSSRVCTSSVSGYIPIPMTMPACYRLHVRDENGKVRDTCLDEADWNRRQVGDQYDGEKRETEGRKR